MIQLLIALLMFFTGCASTGPKYVVDDSVIENVPQNERVSIEHAKNAIINAEAAKLKADADIEFYEKALNDANKNNELATTRYELAEQRLKLARLTQENTVKEILATQNQKELEKAKVVDQRGIKLDKDFSLRNFESATLDAKKESTDAQIKANKLAIEIDELDAKFKKMTEEYKEARNN